MARRLLESGRLPGLLRAVADKGERNARFARVRDDLNLLLRLCAAWWRGEYRALGRQALLGGSGAAVLPDAAGHGPGLAAGCGFA